MMDALMLGYGLVTRCFNDLVPSQGLLFFLFFGS